MTNRILILNGPNLNMLGRREPAHYGTESLDDIISACSALGAEMGVEIEAFQSNSEGELVSKLQEAGMDGVRVVFNPGAYSHNSIALHDAITSAGVDVIEVHISNIHAREEFRHHSIISKVARGVIAGLGAQGYLLAIRAFSNASDN